MFSSIPTPTNTAVLRIDKVPREAMFMVVEIEICFSGKD